MTTHKSATVGQLMTPAPHTIGTEQKLSAAHHVMNENRLRHLPVLRGGKLVGVLSQRDLFFLESIAGVDIDIDEVADAMTADVYTTTRGASVHDVALEMAQHKYGCAVVLEKDRVVGVFTVTDAVRYLAEVLR